MSNPRKPAPGWYTFNAVGQLADGRWTEILRALARPPYPQHFLAALESPGKQVPNPVTGEGNTVFRFHSAGSKKGREGAAWCNPTYLGDGFTVLSFLNEVSRRDALVLVAEYLRAPAEVPPADTARAKRVKTAKKPTPKPVSPVGAAGTGLQASSPRTPTKARLRTKASASPPFFGAGRGSAELTRQEVQTALAAYREGEGSVSALLGRPVALPERRPRNGDMVASFADEVKARAVAYRAGPGHIDVLWPGGGRKISPPAIGEPKQWAKDLLWGWWSGAYPLADSRAVAGLRYYRKRGIAIDRILPRVRDIRVDPTHTYHAKVNGELVPIGTWPCIMALVRDPSGDPVAIHRTWVTEEGGKARTSGIIPDVDTPSKLMSPLVWTGALHGAAIRLSDGEGPVLGVTEGIETALMVLERHGHQHGVWAAYSATQLFHLVPPETTEMVVIYADRDATKRPWVPGGVGMHEAMAAAQHMRQPGYLRKQGLMAVVEAPPMPVPMGQKSIDWLDIGKAAPMPTAVDRLIQHRSG